MRSPWEFGAASILWSWLGFTQKMDVERGYE
jgi:hypothetical protein